MTEAELAQKFVAYLSDYDLYFEAPPGQVDIVAISGKKRIGVEVKTNLNFKVIEQAFDNMRCFHLSYVAVPRLKRLPFAYKICEQLGIGVLEYRADYDFDGFQPVCERIKPRFNKISHHYATFSGYKPYMKINKPGMPNHKGMITDFKITVEKLRKFVSRHPGCTIKEAIEGVPHHYTSSASAKSSIYGRINQGAITCVKLENGKLYLNN